MTTTTEKLVKKVESIEKELKKIQEPHSILGKMHVDDMLIRQDSRSLFYFDIEKYVSKKDLKAWK